MVTRELTADDVLATLTDLFIARGCPAHLRSDNGPEFGARIVREWLQWLDVRTLFIALGRPWENGFSESINGKVRDELLDREIFFTLKEAQVLIERWRQYYNRVPPQRARLSAPGPEAVAWPPLARPPRLALELAGTPN